MLGWFKEGLGKRFPQFRLVSQSALGRWGDAPFAEAGF